MARTEWDIAHAIDFYLNRHWTLEFAASWLGVSERELYDLAYPICRHCLGNGRISAGQKVRKYLSKCEG